MVSLNPHRLTPDREVPSIGSLLPIPYAVATIPDPANWECETAEQVIELCEAIAEMTEDHEEVEYVWNSVDGWDYVSAETEVIEEWCEIWNGESADSSEEIQDIFREAVLREYQTRPKVYSAYSLDELVEYWRPRYNVGNGHFILGGLTIPQEVRVKTDMGDDE